ncbi:MAG TPA: DEAD/DEAH box helicase [Dehalococcoidia bacterium]|nr:DEAD/DEAH box helicase [Dehalococcoidia bacterium]
MSFKEFSLHPQVLSGVISMGYDTPTPIQEQAIPVALEGRDLLGLAQTGTGKTAAFVLPILHHLASTPPKRGVRYLVLAPTRELAEQINDAFNLLGKHLRIKAVSVYGGVAKGPQIAKIRRGAQIVVACPGRLLDHVSHKDIDLTNVEILVLDEADTMCDMGFLPDVQRILNHVPPKRQTLFFSATMPKEIRALAVKILKDPESIQIGASAPAETVSHSIYPVPDKLKKDLLLALLQQTPTGRALVFTRTKHRARSLALELAKNRFRVGALQGNMSQNARNQAMDGFRHGKFDILVATDIAAHGIDVPQVSHVINFDFPNTTDTYTHRIGRTGRAEQTGEAFTFAASEDASMVRHVERELGIKIERRRLEGFDYGNFTPEEQFREDRMGLPRANGGRSNGGRAGQGTRDQRPSGQNRRKPGAWKAGSSEYGRREDHPSTAGRWTDRPSENRSSQPVDAGARASSNNGPSNSNLFDGRSSNGGSSNGNPYNRGQSNGGSSNGGSYNRGPSNGGSSNGNSNNGKRSEQPTGSSSRGGNFDGNRGNRSSQPVSGTYRTSPPDGRGPTQPSGRSSGQILGRTPSTEIENRRKSGQVLGRSGPPSAPNGRRRSQKPGVPSFHPRPAKPGKPRGRSAGKH